MKLVVVGLAMTAVMQSSTASIAVTISAFYAGAVGLEQGAALIVGQNIGTATSSALAAIGASVTAKRLALAYVLFKVIAALIALAAFPFTAALMARFVGVGRRDDAARRLSHGLQCRRGRGASSGDAMVHPLRGAAPAVEGIAARARLDPAALVNPVVAVEAARRAVAEALKAHRGLGRRLALGRNRPAEPGVAAAAAALEKVRDFLSELKEPPETEAERRRMTSTLHALDHASRLAEILGDGGLPAPPSGGPDDLRAAELCKQAMRWTQTIDEFDHRESPALSQRAEPIGWSVSAGSRARRSPRSKARRRRWTPCCRKHRAAILASVAPGQVTAAEAFARIDAVRRLDRIAHHAWRSTAHLLGLRRTDREAPAS